MRISHTGASKSILAIISRIILNHSKPRSGPGQHRSCPIMECLSKLRWKKWDFGFNKDVITGLLRGKYGFEGVVCTDWGLLTSLKVLGREVMPARAWGVEHLSRAERSAKGAGGGRGSIWRRGLP